MRSSRFVPLVGLVLSLSGACVGSDDDSVVSPGGGGGKTDDPFPPGALPADLPAWGGADAARWQPEAIIANAVTAELHRVGDPLARVSIPATLLKSSFAPFGDGQSNAAVTLASWTARRPPLVATRTGSRLSIRFDRALPFSGDTFELWTTAGTWVMSVASTRSSEGDWLIDVTNVPTAIANRLLVSPRGWADVFPLSFTLPVGRVDALAQSVPPSLRTLPGGEPVVDPIGARDSAAADRGAFEVLSSSSFPAGFINQSPFLADELHASFPQGGAPRTTAVGSAFTWVAEQPFKDLYVCFEQRRLDLEAQHGVPSGAGWHHIGDAGESILSSLERAPILIGYADGQPPLTLPQGAQLAYGLDRPTTYGLLQPGEVFTTPRGDFHWYAVHHAQNPCVQIWVHRCEPSADEPSFACAGD